MIKSLNSFLKKFGLPLLVFLASFLLAKAGLAVSSIDVGLNQVSNNIVLSSVSPVTVILRVIQVILGLLSLITVILIMYAGFLWTTSGGSEEKINTAKRIIKNAVIGIIIILSAWGTTYFILNKLIDITGGGTSGPTSVNGVANLSLGTLGSCSIESVYPTPDSKDVSRNASILVTAEGAFDLNTVCIDKDTKAPCVCGSKPDGQEKLTCNLINPANIQIYKTADGNNLATNLANVEVSVPSGNKTLVLKPLGYLGNSSGNVEYAVHLTNNLKKFGGEALFSSCSLDFLEWKFETNTELDLTPPQVLLGNIFPPVDTAADGEAVISKAKAARASIMVTGCPKTYTSASKVSITPLMTSVTADFVVDPNYSGTITDFTVTVSNTANNKLVLSSGSSVLGNSDIVDNKAVFDGYFTVTLSSLVPGNSWNLVVKPATPAETLTVGSNTYIFVSTKSGSGNEILITAHCDPLDTATNIVFALSGNSDIDASNSGGNLTLFAKQTGVSGNSLALSSNSSSLTLTKFSGGAEKSDSYTILGLKDKPMNSVIQVNFNEAMNPMALSGTADEASSSVRLVNANSAAKTNGGDCPNGNSECLSYNCQGAVCVGNYVSGKYSLNNAYKTLEFVSDKECGVNSCGETMYCLPASSHLALRINAAKLNVCNSSADCQSLAPYSDCAVPQDNAYIASVCREVTKNIPTAYDSCVASVSQEIKSNQSTNVCRDVAKNINYPTADSLNPNGVVDLAFNSLDGNRDGQADGPVISVYPYFIEGNSDLLRRDGFEFSFFISNQINSEPPTISEASPSKDASEILVTSPVKIDFNQLMMMSTLRTGSLIINNGVSNTEHKLVNLFSSISSPLGYWLESENKEKGEQTGEPNYTSLKILHSDFFESVTYISQVGSGVKNIYQNCFKPSVGPGCVKSESNPSCCFGIATSTLNTTNGNCIN